MGPMSGGRDDAPVVLVTGTGGGIGGAVAERFSVGGWRVVGVDLRAPDSEGGSELRLDLRADLRTAEACRTAVAEAVSWAHGRLDAVVTAAGLWTEGPCDETTEEEYDTVMAVNVKGTYFVAGAAVPHLERCGGSITMLSSDAGIQGNAGAAVYSASKGAVTNLTRAMALELAPRGVRVNAVCPGDVDTPMLAGQAREHGGSDPQAYLDRLLSLYPQGPRARFIRPAEIAELVWFLAQPSAAPITGANVAIDFGLSAGLS